MGEKDEASSLAGKATVLAIASVIIGGLLLLFDPIGIHAAGYFIGCLVPFTAVALARRDDVRSRGEMGVIAPTWRRSAYVAILVVGFAVAGAHAWAIAWEIARRVQL